MSSKRPAQKAVKLPGFAETFLVGSTERGSTHDEKSHHRRHYSAEHERHTKHDATVKRTSASSSKSPELRGNHFSREQDGLPGNTLGRGFKSPSKSEDTTAQLGSAASSPGQSQKYWDTVLGPSSSKSISGSPGPSPGASASAGNPKPHKCRICPMSFKKRCNLLSHVSNVHDRVRPFQCPVCSRTFARKSNCVKHMKLVHKIPREEIEVRRIDDGTD